MKFVLGIFLVVLVMAAIAVYLLFMLSARSLVPCGDIPQTIGSQMSITRIYTSDLNANETLTQIVDAMNDNENGTITAEDMTEILATYQSIIYAPVFQLNIEQEDTNTFVLTGSVYNGLDEDGEPTNPDFRYRNLAMTAELPQGKFIAAENIYEEDKELEEGADPEFLERRDVVDPLIVADGSGAAFSFRNCDSFRLVFKNTSETTPPSISLAYTYDVVADNPLNFTTLRQGMLGVNITVAYDENGKLVPELVVDRKKFYVEGEEEE